MWHQPGDGEPGRACEMESPVPVTVTEHYSPWGVWCGLASKWWKKTVFRSSFRELKETGPIPFYFNISARLLWKHKGNERSFSILYFSVCLSLALLRGHTHMQKGRVGEKESRALSFKINQFSWGSGFSKGCGSRFHKRTLITPSRTIQPAM